MTSPVPLPSRPTPLSSPSTSPAPRPTRRRGLALSASRPGPGLRVNRAVPLVVLGLLTLAWPLAWAPAWTYAVASLGAVAVVAAAVLHWRRGPALAVAIAVVSCAVSTAGLPVLAAEGVFILVYLLAADAPPAQVRPWLRRQAVLLVAGLIASGAVLAAYVVHPATSPWLTLAALAAVVLAYLVALLR